jgi:hypothetical protein
MLAMLLAVFPFLLSCYTVTLSIRMDETGQGTAWVYMDYHVPEGEQLDMEAANKMLQDKGWTTEQILDAGSGSQMASGYKTFSPGNLNDLIRSVPGFEETASTMSMEIEEEPTLGIKRFKFQSHLVMTGHINNWAAFEDAAQEGFSTDCNDTPLDSPNEDCKIEFSAQEMQQIRDEFGPIRFVLDLDIPGQLEESPGEWTDRTELKAEWDAESPLTALNLRAYTILHPGSEAPEDDTFIANQETLLDRFTAELGNGQIVSTPSPLQNYLTAIFGPGRANNMTNGTMNACGWWQGEVIKWLDSIRLSTDPAQRALLDGLDYGPIQAYYGGHQAVVLYPKGTNWQEQGIVLDPWPNQIPESVSIADWKATFGIGSTLGGELGIGPGQRHENYPHLTGGASSYPDTLTQADRLHFRKVVVNSPVSVLISGPNGARLGALPDGTIVNEIPGADFYPADIAAGGGTWYFGLPEGPYTMEVTGLSEGEMHVLIAGEGKELTTYGAQPVTESGQTTLQLLPGEALSSPMFRDDGEIVQPWAATEEALREVYGDAPAAGGNSGDVLKTVLAAVGGAGIVAVCCAVPAIGLLAFVLMRRRKSQAPTA